MDERKLAVVVGGSSGIGEATAIAFLERGCEVVIAGRDAERLRAASERLGGHAKAEVADAADAGQVADLFGRIGKIDHLVISLSSGGGAGPFRTLTQDQLRAGFEGKFWAYLTVMQAALDSMQQSGSITLVTAGSARAAMPGASGLAAINGALESMVGPLAAELAPLRVNAVSPGIIRTGWWNRVPQEQREGLFKQAAGWIPAGRVGEAKDVAAAVVMVATNEYITGSVIDCAGGAHLAMGPVRAQ